ncbi:MAG: TetR/AcrR family transcriptional regulator [Acidobacteriota bacterium]
MPKLQDRDVERNQKKIERAALRVFTRQGYHGTSVRDITRASGVSIGNLYNYYPTKEELFKSVVRRYESCMDQLRGQALDRLEDVFGPKALQQLARSIRKIVYENPDYWRLMYIDVIEFGNRHFAHTFRHLAKNMQGWMGERIRAGTRGRGWNDMDPALAFTAIYLQFFTYFLVEKLFGGKQHLGVPDERAVAQLIKMVTEGLWRGGPPQKRRRGRRRRKS